MTFHVNQKVVCVDDTLPAGAWSNWSLHGLKKGTVYTVRETGLTSWVDGAPCIRLGEILRDGDTPYWAHRFRPLVTKSTETGMAILRRALEPNQMEVV